MFKICFIFLAGTLFGLEGVYQGSGTDPYENATYTVKATFTEDQNGVTQVVWEEVENGKSSVYAGTGLTQKNRMSFIFQNTQDATDLGLQVYKMKGDALEGPFVMLNKNLVGNEKLTKSK